MARSEEAKQEIAQFAEVHGAPPMTVRSLEPAKGVRHAKLQGKVTELHQRMLDVGNRPASVLNLRPNEVRSQGQHCSNYTLAACPIGQPYTKTIIPSYEVYIAPNEYGDEEPHEVLAIKIAEDIKQQANKNGYRGIIVYMGERNPEDGADQDPRNPARRNLMKEIAEEKAALIEEFKNRVQQANDEWAKSDGKGRKNIDDRHRMAAQYLIHEKLVKKEDVPWLFVSRKTEDVADPCPSCGAEPAKGAMSCKSCGWIIDPKRAYEMGLINDDDPSLRRLAREVLDEMGLKDVLTLAEYRKALKAQKKAEAKAAEPKK